MAGTAAQTIASSISAGALVLSAGALVLALVTFCYNKHITRRKDRVAADGELRKLWHDSVCDQFFELDHRAYKILRECQQRATAQPSAPEFATIAGAQSASPSSPACQSAISKQPEHDGRRGYASEAFKVAWRAALEKDQSDDPDAHKGTMGRLTKIIEFWLLVSDKRLEGQLRPEFMRYRRPDNRLGLTEWGVRAVSFYHLVEPFDALKGRSGCHMVRGKLQECVFAEEDKLRKKHKKKKDKDQEEGKSKQPEGKSKQPELPDMIFPPVYYAADDSLDKDLKVAFPKVPVPHAWRRCASTLLSYQYTAWA